MSLIDDGVIKFDNSAFIKADDLLDTEFAPLENWRKKLFQLQLIGEYPVEKVGYGNMSWRRDYSQYKKTQLPQFVITGTQTGKWSELNGRQYTRVLSFDLAKNKIEAMGPVDASSESLTHAALYQASTTTNAIFHIHHKELWQKMLDGAWKRTPKDIPYGTQEMAIFVQTLFTRETSGIFAMEGHEDGIIAFASSLDQCGELILETYHQLL